MKIISYVQWTEPGEKDKFRNLAIQFRNDDALKEAIIKEFEVSKVEALTMLLRFRNEITKWRNQ